MTTDAVALVDGNYLINRAFYSTGGLRTSDGLRIGAVYGFLGAIKHFLKTYRDHLVIIVWDGGRSPRRLALHPEYKHARRTSLERPDEAQDDDGWLTPFQCAQEAHKLCRYMGLHSFGFDDAEGDDVIAVLARATRRAVVYSADRDFYQLVDASRTVHSPRRQPGEEDDLVVTVETFREASGGYPDGPSYRIGHALAGDSSDNIKGVRGVGKKSAAALCCELREAIPAALHPKRTDFVSIRDFCAAHRSKRIRRVAEDEGWEAFQRALALTDLWRDDLLTPAQMSKLRRKLGQSTVIQHEALMGLLERWEMMTELENVHWLIHDLANRPKDAAISL